MQGKVSMVMPCYNKVKFIGEMFDSILAQQWNNIELILVNDGSTDGTRDVIAEYEPKFRKRGFEVTIIDQKNAGVCAAAKEGLIQATGDYICMVDSDDELDPKYISVMADWLETNADYDYCICDTAVYKGSGKSKTFDPIIYREIHTEEPYHLERYLLSDIRTTVWVYLARAEYLKKCNIVQTYFTDTKGSHEPGYIIPIIANKGKYKYFPQPLYLFNESDFGHSRQERFEQQRKFYEEYERLCRIAINLLPEHIADSKRKEHLIYTVSVSKNILCYQKAKGLQDGHDYADQILAELIEAVNKAFELPTPNTKDGVIGNEHSFISAVRNKLLGILPVQKSINPSERIIGYGALGKAAARMLPLLKNTPIKPTELWDINGDGEIIKKPEFNSLEKEDLLLVFPLAEQVLNQVKAIAPCAILSNEEIINYLSCRYVGENISKGVD
ncbi:glycosyltransferase family 2 protein [Cohnella sp. GCM10020058]|uniref:glycosyltransferase family 2 protein n=1 Tax=Cohnella sp. GCM10020058 TaxID=3317330 RepID=UPI00363D162F